MSYYSHKKYNFCISGLFLAVSCLINVLDRYRYYYNNNACASYAATRIYMGLRDSELSNSVGDPRRFSSMIWGRGVESILIFYIVKILKWMKRYSKIKRVQRVHIFYACIFVFKHYSSILCVITKNVQLNLNHYYFKDLNSFFN